LATDYSDTVSDLTVASALGRYAGGRAYFQLYPGNHGDRLIDLGSEEAIRRSGLSRVDRAAAADVIVFKGGFGLSQTWGDGIEPFRAIAQAAPTTPIVLLPSTVDLAEGILRSCLARRRAPTLLFARERRTYDRLRSMHLGDDVTVALDHDMAFWLQGTEWLARFAQTRGTGKALVILRDDAEAGHPSRDHLTLTPARLGDSMPSRLLRTAVPFRARLALRRHLLARRQRPKEMTADELAGLARAIPELPRDAGDIRFGDLSMPEYYSFRQFTAAIAEASVVVTNRLHAGIFSAMLGRRTVFLTDQLGKVTGVVEYSQSRMTNASCLDRTNLASQPGPE
jgi:exopolysaccharide biosynthesis predicted pyruvyltransferase EpsI